MKKAKKINGEERGYIEYLRNEEKRSVGKIARIMKRSKSSISEELRRVKGLYDSEKAEEHRYRKQYHKTYEWMKVAACPKLSAYVSAKMKEDWSPEEIAGRIKYIDTDIPRATTPSIYKYIYSIYGRQIEQYLRYGRQTKKDEAHASSGITDRTFIDKRPKKVEKRRFFGDWEADFIVSGKDGSGYLAVFVERKTRYVVVRKIAVKDVHTVHSLFQKILGGMFLVSTLTIDNDIVFRKHKDLSEMIGAPVYFTHPYHSWEKGTVENMNKWIRQYVPKKSDISKLTDEYVQMIEDKLNNRPRKCLRFKTPREAMEKERGVKKDVALLQCNVLQERFGLGV